MPSFLYKARIEGEVQQNEIEAESQNKAIVKLQQKSIKPLSIKKIKNNQQVNSKGSLFSKRKQEITEKNMVVFTRTFSALIDAGLPLVQCLDILGKQNENPSFGEIIIAIKKNIESGDTLSESLKDYPEVFNSLYCNLVEAGEAAGILDTILIPSSILSSNMV